MEVFRGVRADSRAGARRTAKEVAGQLSAGTGPIAHKPEEAWFQVVALVAPETGAISGDAAGEGTVRGAAWGRASRSAWVLGPVLSGWATIDPHRPRGTAALTQSTDGMAYQQGGPLCLCDDRW